MPLLILRTIRLCEACTCDIPPPSLFHRSFLCFFFFFQAEDGIRDDLVTGVQTCALPILSLAGSIGLPSWVARADVESAPATSSRLVKRARAMGFEVMTDLLVVGGKRRRSAILRQLDRAPRDPAAFDHRRDRVDAEVIGQVQEVRQREQRQVGALAHLDRADLAAQAEAASGVQGGRGEALLDRQAELED